MKPVLLKIGGSVLTDKNHECTLNKDNLERIAGEIAKASTPIIIVHGAGSFGHPHAKKHNVQHEPTTMGITETHRAVTRLNNIVVQALQSAGVVAIGVHPLNCMLIEKDGTLHFDRRIIQKMVDTGITPTLHGDVVMDTVKGVSVISGDRILTQLAEQINISTIGAGTNVDGVLDEHKKTIPVITPENFERLSEHIRDSAGEDVTGGMAGKVAELLHLAESGINSTIFNAEKKGSVFNFLSGNPVTGTLISRGEQ